MKKIFLTTILILLAFTISHDAYAATYYVDFDNGSDSNDGTSTETAWKNIPGTCSTATSSKVTCTFLTNNWATINAGDTIKIKSGTTHDYSDGGRILVDSAYYNDGTSNQPIKIQRDIQWGSGTVVIDGAGITVANYYAMLNIITRDYIIIDGIFKNGIKIQNSSENGIFVYDSGDNGFELRNSEVYNSTKINIKITSSDKGTPTYIGNITLYNIEAHKTSTTGDSGSNISIAFGENLLIQFCRVYDAGGDGIHLGSSRNSWILDNMVYNNGVDGEQGIDISIDGDYKGRFDGYSITVRNNIAYDNYKMNFDHNSGVYDIYYIHNVSWNTRVIEKYDGNMHLYEGTAGKNFWINNTTSKGRDWGFGAVWSSNPWNIPAGTYQQYFINNITSGDGGESVNIDYSYNSRIFGANYYNNNFHSADGTTVVKDKGTLYTAANINDNTGGWPGTNCISNDPLFVATGITWETTDLNLDASSPSKDSGVFPFTTSSSGSGAVIILNKLVADIDARRVFRSGDDVQIEGSGKYIVSSVDSSNQITLTSNASWEAEKGVWFPWYGLKVDMGAYEYVPEEPDSTLPSTPTNIQAPVISSSQIDLTWDASADTESGINHYNIYRDGSKIGQSTIPSFTDTGLSPDTTYSYEISAVNGAGLESAKSNPVSETTFADTTTPSVVSVLASKTSVEVVFSEPLEESSAININNYAINNGITITFASLSTDLKTVTLTTSAHTQDITYTLTVSNVKDIAGNTMSQTMIDYQYASGLVGYWKFDEGSGTIVEDSSGNSNDVTVNGATWTNGKIGGALSFDGVDDYVGIGTNDFNASSGTIVLWIMANGFSEVHYIFGHTTTPAYANRIQLYTDDSFGNLDLGLGDSHVRATAIQDLDTGIWYCIALTWDGTDFAVYVEGILKASGTYSGLSSIHTFADIGNNGDANNRSQSWDGLIDHVRTYNRALSATEIQAIYDSESRDTIKPQSPKELIIR